MIQKPLIRRFLLYSLCLTPCVFLLVQKIHFTKFNVDEFQHTYLAWSSAFFNQIQYRDMWDNHGILYTLFNTLMLKIFKPEIGIPALMLERYSNLALLLISFLILFELMFLVFKRTHYACVAGVLLTLSSLSLKAIEIRPDNLQCVFLYLSLLLLFKSLESNKNNEANFQKLAFGAGFSSCLTMMVNLKSYCAILAIIVVLVGALILNRSTKTLKIITNFGAGLGLGLGGFAIIFSAYGILLPYIKYNIEFNYLITHKYAQINNSAKILDFFTRDSFFISAIVMIGLLIFIIDTYWINKKNILEKSILLLIIAICLYTRFFVYVYRLQFDLMYFPLACALASYAFFRVMEYFISSLQAMKWVFVIVVIFLAGAFNLSLQEITTDKRAHKLYLDVFQKRFLAIKNYPSEYIDYYTLDNCPGFGFSKNASFLFFKYKKSMLVMEEIEKKELFGASYIDLLENKKVKLIIGTPAGINENHHLVAREYIFKNYKYHGCIWERLTPFLESNTTNSNNIHLR
jgi:hypothetical protein